MKNLPQLLLLVLILISTLSFSQQQKYSKVKIDLKGNSIMEIAKLGVAVDDGIIRDKQSFTAEISESEIALIQNAGYTCEIIIDDMAKFYRDRNKQVNTKDLLSTNTLYQTPANFRLGSFAGYFTYDELLQELDSMKSLFPNLISVKQSIGTGTSIEGRTIYYVKISDNPEVDESEPEVIYTGLHHAREPVSMQQLVYYMYYLLENYETNEEIKYLVDNLELYFVPCVNPDGYTYNQTTDPNGGGLWRKNRRDNGDGSFGADLNRNYGYNWGYDDVGSSPNTNVDTYRGTDPFSEPETQMMRDFTESREFRIALNYHTYSDLLVIPWGFEADYFTPDSALFDNYCQLLTSENNYMYGTPSQTVGYTGNGDANDWMYGEQSTKGKIIAFTPEAGTPEDGFWPQIDRIEAICSDNVGMDLYIARLALKYAVVEDLSPMITSNLQNQFDFNIKNLGLDTTSTFTVSISELTSQIVSTGAPITFDSMQLLEEAEGSISFELNSQISNGENFGFIVHIDNGLYTYNDTIWKIFGQETVLIEDSCETIDNWTSNTWSTTEEDAHSGISSITDSKNASYGLMQNASITTTNTIDLTNMVYSHLSFYAKWDIENDVDFVQLSVSTDNGTSWTPLEGNYTNNGTSSQNENTPVYDGRMSNWTQEIINLNNYIGENLLFKFTLKSDYSFWNSYDGFYFDDFEIVSILGETSDIAEVDNISAKIFPNPAKNDFKIIFNKAVTDATIEIYTVTGEKIFAENIAGSISSKRLNISTISTNIATGIYYIKIQSQELNQTMKLFYAK